MGHGEEQQPDFGPFPDGAPPAALRTPVPGEAAAFMGASGSTDPALADDECAGCAGGGRSRGSEIRRRAAGGAPAIGAGAARACRRASGWASEHPCASAALRVTLSYMSMRCDTRHADSVQDSATQHRAIIERTDPKGAGLALSGLARSHQVFPRTLR